jgi:hypothetical protein
MVSFRRGAALVALLLAVDAFADSAEELKKAQTAVAKKKWGDANKALANAANEAGNDLETTLKIWELQAVALAGQNKLPAARETVQKLLSVDPKHQPPRGTPAKVQALYKEGQKWLVKNPPLVFTAGAPETEAGKITAVALVKSDPMKLGAKVLFNFKIGAKWKTRVVALANGRAESKVDQEQVEWYAVLLSEKDAELSRFGSVDAPKIDKAPPAAAAPKPAVAQVEPAPKPAPEPVKKDPPRDETVTRTEIVPPVQVEGAGNPTPDLTERPRRSTTLTNVLGFGMIGLGVAAGGVGTFFAFQSKNARDQFASSTNTGMDPVIGFTRANALELDQQARMSALLANTLWIAGGALLVTGLLVKLLGPDEPVEASP